MNNLIKTEQEKNNLWGAGMFSQIVYWQYGKNKFCNLTITTNKEQHESLVKGFKRQGIKYQELYMYSNS
jgi:hypothetical protein|tara:strand:+ start:45 stop:251 length:207 start_codon:yes stop_codon:yes gene_type:complete